MKNIKYRLLALVFLFAANAPAQITLELQDYVALPLTGMVDGKTNYDALLARVSGFREEPGGANRLFVADLNGPLYIIDKATRKPTVYLDFNGREGRKGIFHKLFFEAGFGSGLNTLYFDPDYRRNGKFYTVHLEDPAAAGSNMPDNANFPGFNIAGYTTTPAIRTPGPILYEGVLIEWTDTNTSNATFEGTARELLRIQFNTRIHLLGDLIFNPAARPGDSDWRVLYISSGDGGSGEANTSIRSNPQRLDNLSGKILRLIPDLNEHVGTSTVSENGRYRTPNDNPFVSKPGARKEIWAYGMRNPHRLAWAVDPANPANNRLIANSVGLHTWETVNIIHKGANYGYSQREGNELLQADNKTAKLPAIDRIPVQVSDITDETAVPTYPVIEYGHVPGGGDAIGSGFLYNGKALPALRGKYVFGDITTGRIWYADYKEMLAADDGNPATLAPTYELKLRWNGQVYDSMFRIAETGYRSRGGKNPGLSGRPTVSTAGRADARLAVDAAGELYVCTRSDGMIARLPALREIERPTSTLACDSLLLYRPRSVNISIGLIGGGNITDTHARAVRAVPGASVAAIYGTNVGKVRRLAGEHGGQAYAELDAFLAHRPMDMVIIGSPSGVHADHGIAAVRRGLHVLVEKPIDINTSRAGALIEEAEKAGVRLGVIFQDRLKPGIQRMKELVDRGALGTPILADARVKWYRPPEYYSNSPWRGTHALDGGAALINQGIHTVDLLLWLLGDVRRVQAVMRTSLHIIEGEDTLAALLEFENGALGVLQTATSIFPGYPRRIELTGSEGTAILEHDRLIEVRLRRGESASVFTESLDQNPSSSSPIVSDHRAHQAVLEDFIRAIETNSRPVCDGFDGLRSLALIESIYKGCSEVKHPDP